MSEVENKNIKSEFREALKNKFFSVSIIVFWLMTGFVLIFAKYKSDLKSQSLLESTELSSQSPIKNN